MNPELNLNVEQHDFEKLAAQSSPASSVNSGTFCETIRNGGSRQL